MSPVQEEESRRREELRQNWLDEQSRLKSEPQHQEAIVFTHTQPYTLKH